TKMWPILFWGMGMTKFIASVAGRSRKMLPATLVLAGATFASSAALAQGADSNVTTNNGGIKTPTVASGMSQSGAAIAGAISAVETAFLTQQGSAFVSAPGNPQPNQPGGGIWIRGVGGEANISSNSSSTMVATQSGTPTTLVTANVN